MPQFDRITARPEQMGGAACIRGLRIPVSTIIAMIAEGMTAQQIVEAYPDLDAEDVTEALRFAAQTVEERQVPTLALSPSTA